MKTLVCDLETDGLRHLATRIWCIVAIDADTEDVFQFDPTRIQEGLALLSSADRVVFHNGIMFDIPLIKKLYPSWTYKTTDDTFILSSLFNPDRAIPAGCKGAHGIDAWGKRFGIAKPKHEDWSKYTPEMMHRCTQDARIGLLTYRYLNKKRQEWDWEQSIRLEYKCAEIQAQQEDNGVWFNKRAAIDLWMRIVKELQGIDKSLLSRLPLRTVPLGATVQKPFKKDGNHIKQVVDYFLDNQDYLKKVKGPFTRVAYERFNLNSDQQIKKYLLTEGWKPIEWNYKKEPGTKKFIYDDSGQKIKTSPKLTEDSYGSIKGGMGQLLARRNVLMHRKGLIYSYSKQQRKPLGWLTNIREDGRIAAEAVPQACNTGRYQHRVVVNVPKASDKVVYGAELRALFGPPDGSVFVGWDASALEARTEAHNCYPFKGGKEYAAELLEGDIHSKNAVVFGTDRDGAKSPKYALTYGCTEGKLAETLGCSPTRAKELYQGFWETNTALSEFKDAVVREYKANKKKWGYGFITGLDGRQLIGRSLHSLVNLKFQSDGAILIKTATCYLFGVWVPKYKVNSHICIQQHDEVQAWVHPRDVKKYCLLSVQALEQAGRFYKYRVPITGETKTGKNWAETH